MLSQFQRKSRASFLESIQRHGFFPNDCIVYVSAQHRLNAQIFDYCSRVTNNVVSLTLPKMHMNKLYLHIKILKKRPKQQWKNSIHNNNNNINFNSNRCVFYLISFFFFILFCFTLFDERYVACNRSIMVCMFAFSDYICSLVWIFLTDGFCVYFVCIYFYLYSFVRSFLNR